MVFGQPGQDHDLQDQNPPEQFALPRRGRAWNVGVVCHGDIHGADRVPSFGKAAQKHRIARRAWEESTGVADGKKMKSMRLRQNARRRCDILSEMDESILRNVAVEEEGGGGGGEGFALDDGGQGLVEVDGAGIDEIDGGDEAGAVVDQESGVFHQGHG